MCNIYWIVNHVKCVEEKVLTLTLQSSVQRTGIRRWFFERSSWAPGGSSVVRFWLIASPISLSDTKHICGVPDKCLLPQNLHSNLIQINN